MKKLPKVAIVGRPNVGKSALFNKICGRRIAIVDEAEGVTRDRLYFEANLFSRPFLAIDTGGINARSQAIFNEEVKRQAEIAIEEADTLIMVVDAKVGVTLLDREVANLLLRTKKPLVVAINKVDNREQNDTFFEFQSLGIEKMVPVSATQNWHIAELLEAALDPLPVEESEDEAKGTKVAILGRPNVGKSSLVNKILNEERCIVSDIPGTTRDSIDTEVEINKTPYTFIDTAGIRRKGAEHDVVDKFAYIRTKETIERADVCLLMLDAQEGITSQEKRIANAIEEAGKGCLLILNKWDLIKGFQQEHVIRGITEEVPFLKHCPILCLSAKTGRNLEKIFPAIEDVLENTKKRLPTHQLNKFVGECIQRVNPPMIQGKRLRIYYMAQVDISPPKFVFFVNDPKLMTETYKKYLYNQFRKEYAFTGAPISLLLKGKAQKPVE
jgi:GTP-binding protein